MKKGDTAKAYYVADILPGGSGENGRYVIVGLKLAAPDGPPSVTHVAFRADQFDRFLIQLLDNSARARFDRLKHNPPPEEAVLNIEAAALPVVTGIDRDLYLADRDGARQQIRDALSALEAWKKNPSRPAAG